MGNLWNTYRAVRHEKLPTIERWEVADISHVGEFPVGRAAGILERLRYRPVAKRIPDPPHCAATGSSGGGKSSLLEPWAILPMLWNEYYGADWDPTTILDPKGGADYFAAENQGAIVVSEIGAIRDQLKSAYNHAERRNRLKGEIPITVKDGASLYRESRAQTFGDFSPEQRAEYNMRPRLLVIDELADLLGVTENDKAIKAVYAQARAHFTNLAQKARSAGIVVVVGIQRMDAKIMDGFTRDQIQARIAVGNLGPEGWVMALGRTVAKMAEDEAEFMTPGHGWTRNIGGKSHARVYVGYVDRTTYLPYAEDPDKAPAALTPEEAPLRRRGESTGTGGKVVGAVQGLRAVVTGPAVRLGLRVHALRLLVGPTVAGGHYRDPRVVWAAQDAGKGRCKLCGRGGQLEVDHRRPLWAGGADTIDNVWLLCARAGLPSCHGTKTYSAEGWVRRVRKAAGTLKDEGPDPDDRLGSRLVDLAKAIPPFAAVFAAIYFTGLVEPSRWWLAATVVVVIGLLPLLVKYQMREARAIPQEDYAIDPTLRRQAYLETQMGKKKPRRWWSWYLISHHLRNANWTARRRWTLQASGYYLLGAFTPKIVMIVPPLLLGLLGVIL